ncbi:MAG: hypothetical protein MRZ79_15535 [Bacteroidia bacterium]|nr:hypothetical protein [Bacteroidia bacterium]
MQTENIDYQRLNKFPPKVITFLEKRFKQNPELSKLRTLHLGDDLTKYGQQSEEILIESSLDKVWTLYTEEHPSKTWSGPMVNFIFAYLPKEDKLMYPSNEEHVKLQIGSQFYCWLNIFGPRLVIGMKLLDLDADRKYMEIAYIEGGLYKGVQSLQFLEEGENSTKLIHKSYFKSDAAWRDATLYPFFHRMTVGEFHRNKKRKLELG